MLLSNVGRGRADLDFKRGSSQAAFGLREGHGGQGPRRIASLLFGCFAGLQRQKWNTTSAFEQGLR